MSMLIANASMSATIFGWWELVLVLAVILVLLLAKRLPELARGVGEGMREFRKASDDVAEDVGKSLGGIHGKPAAQALTPDNQTAELYDPVAFKDKDGKGNPKQNWFRAWHRFWRLIWRVLISLLRISG